jgi:hypothetical protein
MKCLHYGIKYTVLLLLSALAFKVFIDYLNLYVKELEFV